MYAIYAYVGVVWGVNVGISYMAYMECLGMTFQDPGRQNVRLFQDDLWHQTLEHLDRNLQVQSRAS